MVSLVDTLAGNYSAEEVLRDGRPVTIRSLHAEDRPLWQEVFEHMSPTSKYYRFFTPKRTMTVAEVAYFTELDFVTHVALIAIVHDALRGSEPAAVGRYHVLEKSPQAAEIAFAVEDDFQGLGLGTLLLKHLVVIAREAGLSEFVAFVLSENTKMLEVFENFGLPMKKELKEFTMWEVRLALAGEGQDPSA